MSDELSRHMLGPDRAIKQAQGVVGGRAMSDELSRHSLVTERRLKEAMEKLDKHHRQIAGRLRTIWRREDDAWARGEELAPPEAQDHTAELEPDYLRPTLWERFSGYWHRF